MKETLIEIRDSAVELGIKTERYRILKQAEELINEHGGTWSHEELNLFRNFSEIIADKGKKD